MVRGFVALLLCQLFGEIVARAAGLPVPGPVLGMALLVALLWGLGRHRMGAGASTEVESVADGLLANLGLLFVPAGVGVIQYGGLLASYGLAIGAAVVVSTLAALLATVGTFLAVKALMGRGVESEP